MAFEDYDRAAIEAALAECDPNNPIVEAMAQRVIRIADAFAEQAERIGEQRDKLVFARPKSAFEEIVVERAVQVIESDIGQPVTVQWLEDLELTNDARSDWSVAALVRIAAVAVSMAAVAFVAKQVLS